MEGKGIILRHAHSYAVLTAADGTRQEYDRLSCCHCKVFWTVQPGSGNQRGYCTMCSAVTCGAVACQPCVPFEKKLLALEARERLMAALRS